MLGKVFEMFTQVDRTLEKAQGGLGIGLTLVRRLVEMHGGSVEAHSEGAGTGSEFTVRLPAVLVAPARDERAAEAERPAARPRRRILVVDDNRDSAISLGMMLRTDGQRGPHGPRRAGGGGGGGGRSGPTWCCWTSGCRS